MRDTLGCEISYILVREIDENWHASGALSQESQILTEAAGRRDYKKQRGLEKCADVEENTEIKEVVGVEAPLLDILLKHVPVQRAEHYSSELAYSIFKHPAQGGSSHRGLSGA